MFQGLQYDVNQVMALALGTGLFTSLATIQQPDGVLGQSGAPSGTFVDVTGLVGIACMDAVPSPGSISATEARGMQEILSKGYRHVLLNGYYPQVTVDKQIPTNWRAIVDGVTYDILGVEHDSQNQMTRIHLQLVTL